jgi:hypothetical protein
MKESSKMTRPKLKNAETVETPATQLVYPEGPG